MFCLSRPETCNYFTITLFVNFPQLISVFLINFTLQLYKFNKLSRNIRGGEFHRRQGEGGGAGGHKEAEPMKNFLENEQGEFVTWPNRFNEVL